MRINNEFTVSAPVEKAWEVMLDLERVAPCLPGASIQDYRGGGEYAGTMKVRIGPVTANYKGTVKIGEADEENHRAVLDAKGSGGQGTASATIISTLQEEDGRTRVSVETDMKLTGRAAQFGRGGIAQDVAAKMLGQFADCLEREISGSGAAPPAEDASAANGDGSRARQEGASAAPPVRGTGGLGNVISSEPGTAAAGGSLAGAVVSEPGPAAAAAGQRASRPEPEAFDLGAAGREALLKRAAPALAALGVLALAVWLWRRQNA